MDVALFIVSAVLAAMYVLLAIVVPIGAFVANRALVLRNEDRHVSATPIVGSIAGTLAVLLAPIGTIRERAVWAWVPITLEVTVYVVLVVLWIATGLEARAELQRRERRERR